MGTRIYHATGAEIEQWSRIHDSGLILLPESVGKLWAGTWLEVDGGSAHLCFRLTRMSRTVQIAELTGGDVTAACFPAIRPGVLHRWWIGLPHGWDSRATAAWVAVRRPKPFPSPRVFVEQTN
jgi:hypothetical protein